MSIFSSLLDDETVMIDRVSFTAPFEAEVPSPAS